MLFIFYAIQLADAQYKLNFGLTQTQPSATFPLGLGKPDKAVAKNKMTVPVRVAVGKDGRYLLNDGWELADGNTVNANLQSLFSQTYNSSNWYNAVVPGTVLTSLVAQGIYPDPYMGLNNLAIPDSLCRIDWWYRLAFTSPVAGNHTITWLNLDGINYKADIWLNGKLVGNMEGAFVRGKYNVTGILKNDGKNILAIHIYPPANPGIPHEQSKLAGAGPNGGQLALDGPTFISSEGWDWVPGIRDRNIGIWQNVFLAYTGDISIGDAQVISNLPLPDTSYAELTIKTPVTNHSHFAKKITLEGTIGDIHFTMPQDLQPGETKNIQLTPQEIAVLKIKHPKLWWPNGYGAPNLHVLQLKVLDQDGKIADIKTISFGIRELSYDLLVNTVEKKPERINYQPTDVLTGKAIFDNINRVKTKSGIFIPSLVEGTKLSKLNILPDSTNPFLVIKVNGQKVFCKGGNWGMDDAMKRVERERLEPAFRLHREANFNMIRNWTGECTEDIFYQLADEYGMLVWNDFWMSTEGYNLNPLNDPLMMDNIRETVKRFRNHPSIAIWCPRNEGYAPVSIENEIAEILVKEDGTRHYSGNSREINLRQSGGWHYTENIADYFTKNAEGFTTEIGTYSVPVASTIRKFIKQEDLWPIGDAWYYHDLHSDVTGLNLKGYLNAVDSMYGKASGLDDFSKKAQLINYESHRAIFEAWNSKQWKNASGILLWMTHPAWPSMIWQTYSWDYETHGSFYGAKKGSEPLHIQMNADDKAIVVINNSIQAYKNITAVAKWYDIAGKEIYAKSKKINLAINDLATVFSADLPGIAPPPVYLVRLTLVNKASISIAENAYWRTNAETKNFKAFNGLPATTISYKHIQSIDGSYYFRIKNESASIALSIKLNLLDAKGDIVLPAFFSHGYFDLLPNEEKLINLTAELKNLEGYRIGFTGYNIIPSNTLIN